MNVERVLVALAAGALAMVTYAILFGGTALEEACRVVNVPLAILAAALFFVRVNDSWHRYGLGGRLTRLGILAVLIVVAYGSGEAYVTHAPTGPRSVAMSLALAATTLGLALIPNDHTRTRS